MEQLGADNGGSFVVGRRDERGHSLLEQAGLHVIRKAPKAAIAPALVDRIRSTLSAAAA